MNRLHPDFRGFGESHHGKLIVDRIRHAIDFASCAWLVFLTASSGLFESSSSANGPQQFEQAATVQSSKLPNVIYRAADLQVPDVSQVDDVDWILDQLVKGPRASQLLVTGGGRIRASHEPLKTSHVEMWNRRFTVEEEMDPRVRRLIEIGEPARGRIHKRILGAEPLVAGHLALVLRSIGTEQSVPMLIELLDKQDVASSGQQRESNELMAMISTTSALWELTGRKHAFTAEQWLEWWTNVKQDFALPRRRTPTAITQEFAARVGTLVDSLRSAEQPAAEQLVAMGPAVLSHLLAVLGTVKEPTSKPTDISLIRPFAYRLAWVIDELGGLSELPRELRQEYCTIRQLVSRREDSPLEELAFCRALSHCSFKDFCSLCIDAEKRKKELRNLVPGRIPWYFADAILFSRRFGQHQPRFISGDPKSFPHWNDVIPASNPTQEIADAIPVIVQGLKDKENGVRVCAAFFADKIGLCSSEQPKELIDALAKAWLEEEDSGIRRNISTAVTRFSTSAVLKSISEGLHSNRLELASDAAGMFGFMNIKLTAENRKDFDRLLELSHHSEDRVRTRAVRSLATIEPMLLAPEFARLAKDENDDVRESVIRSIRSLEKPAHATILIQLAKESTDRLRIDAIAALGKLKDPAILPRLLPFLKDKKLGGVAVASMVQLGGSESLPYLMSELAADNDVDGMVYQHLRRLTGQSFESRPQLWLDWWKLQK